jgi:hypothetical protein
MQMTETRLVPSPSCTDIYDAFSVRLLLTMYFQNLVNSGHAKWTVNPTGVMELRVDSGEIYLLEQSAITRLQ